MQIPRYLVPFDTHRLPRLETDVLVIGSGIAGLRAAIEAAAEVNVLLVTKATLSDSSSDWAQGGIAASIRPPDSAAEHVADTCRAGAGLCDVPIVQAIVDEAPAAIGELIEWGAAFDRHDGGLALTREGGHTQDRVLHARGDSTGTELIGTLLARAERAPRLRILEHTYAIDLVTDDDGACRGALVFTRHGEFQFIEAAATLLASGGCGQLYRETTNPPVATGDGQAMAYRAGARLADVEFVQFHPTTLYIAGSERTLISEAVRGEGAHLRNALGERFMPDIHPLAELAPRDIVSRAIVTEMSRTGATWVHLDLRHLPTAAVFKRFPRIAELCRTFRLDLANEMIPVRPSAHYHVGGVHADLDGRTDVPGLLACGEVACTGFHGANRLGSNSLLEGLVVGIRTGRAAIARARESRVRGFECVARPAESDVGAGPINMSDLERSLKSCMWRQVGIERSAAELEAGLRQFQFWSRYIWGRTFFRPEGWSLQNLMTLGWVIAGAALSRQESRGTHYRTDFPEPATEVYHSLCRRGSLAVDSRPVVARTSEP